MVQWLIASLIGTHLLFKALKSMVKISTLCKLFLTYEFQLQKNINFSHKFFTSVPLIHKTKNQSLYSAQDKLLTIQTIDYFFSKKKEIFLKRLKLFTQFNKSDIKEFYT